MDDLGSSLGDVGVTGWQSRRAALFACGVAGNAEDAMPLLDALFDLRGRGARYGTGGGGTHPPERPIDLDRLRALLDG